MNTRILRTILVATTALAGMTSVEASAQDATGTAEAAATADVPDAGGEIIVTGSRIKKDGFDSPVPVTVVDSALIENLAQTNAADVVKLMPSNIASQSDTNSGTSTSANAGSQYANLRGLNPINGTRTLALVNTRRFVPTSDGGQVDLNLVPSIMISRVETVTGGASAAYGSDAVAGVVNVILDNSLTGFKGQVDYTQTGRGDGKGYHAAAAYGLKFAEDRGHILIGGEYQRNEGIAHCARARSWCGEGWAYAINAGAIRAPYDRNDRRTLNQNQSGRSSVTLNTSGYNVVGSPGYGQPNYVLGRDVGLVYNTSTGVIRNYYQAGSSTGTVYSAIYPEINPPTALIDKVFSRDGKSVSDYFVGDYAPKLVAGVSIGGDNIPVYDDSYIQTPTKRYATYLSGSYELTDTLKLSTELSYADRKARSRSFTAGTRSTMPIRADNAYLPASVAALMNAPQAAGSSPYPLAPYTFSFGKDLDEELDNTVAVEAKAFRGVVGLSGSLFSDWTWDTYYQYGQNKRHSSVNYSRNNDAFFMAIDAVRSNPADPNSSIICRPLNEATISSALAAGRFSQAYVTKLRALHAQCKPLNLFGVGNMSPEAIAYAFQSAVEDFKFKEHVASASASGTLLQGWAGPISLATGVDFRHDQGDVTHGGVNPNDYAFSFGLDYAGKIRVLEGFAELNVPLLRDSPLGDMLEVNGAVRYTNNKSTDTLTNESRTVNATSWKVGGIYDVFNGLRLRATQSRDIRAAGFRELFNKVAPTEAGTAQGRVNNFNKSDPSKGGVAGADAADATPIYAGGNFTLSPEKADTTTAGIVVSPPFARGLKISLDWYQIKLKDAIAQLTGQRVTDLCHDAGLLCERVTYATPLDITKVVAGGANVGQITTRGFDFEASYRLPLGEITDLMPGTLDTRFLLNHQYDFIIQQGPGAIARDYAGQTGPVIDQDFYPSSKWMWNLLTSYSTDRFNLTAIVRHIGKGIYNVERIGPEDEGYSPQLQNSITTNRVEGATYLNLAMSYALPIDDAGRQEVELFGSIDNVFDKKPPIAPGGSTLYPTNPVHFDTLGTRWKAGARVKF